MARKAKKDQLHREQERASSIIALQRQNDIIALLLEGKESSEIKTYVMEKYACSPTTSAIYVTQARKIITARKNFEVDNLINIHIERYEHIYAKLYELRAYMEATNTLKRKEKLLGFNREGFHMKVTRGEITAITMQQVNDEFDVMKLSEEKRNRMNFLLNKAAEKKVKNVIG